MNDGFQNGGPFGMADLSEWRTRTVVMRRDVFIILFLMGVSGQKRLTYRIVQSENLIYFFWSQGLFFPQISVLKQSF